MTSSSAAGEMQPFKTRRGIFGFFCTFFCGTLLCYFPFLFASVDNAEQMHQMVETHTYFNEFVLVVTMVIMFNVGLVNFFLCGEPLATKGGCLPSDSETKDELRATYEPLKIEEVPARGATTAEGAYDLWCSPYAANEHATGTTTRRKPDDVCVREGTFVYNGTRLSNLDFSVEEYFEDGDERV